MDRIKILLKISLISAVFLLCNIFQADLAFCSPKNIKIYKEYHGKFLTTVKGISNSRPPYIRVIRSKEGINHLFNTFRKIRNLTTHNKARYLERALLKNNFSSKMVIAILSYPSDNYELDKVKILELEDEQKVEVKVSYFHKNKEYSIPPFKSIYYKFYVVKRNQLPVVLNPELAGEKTALPRKKKLKTIYGTLQNWDNHGKQLVLVNKKKRKKRAYYIKGSLQEELEKYVGKFMALRGEVTQDSESIYEADFLVKKIVKVF